MSSLAPDSTPSLAPLGGLNGWFGSHLSLLLAAVAILGLVTGTLLWFGGLPAIAPLAWMTGTAPVLLALLAQIVTSLRRGDVGLDIVAALSMSAALAFGEPLAGNVVALMYAGGQLLETFAAGRARREMTALLGRVAKTALVYTATGLVERPITAIIPGDRLLIRQGEVLPVDGTTASPSAELDMSALTGESVPVRVGLGGDVLSGSTSVGASFDLVAVRPAAESTYAGIVRLVEAAQSSKAPMVRLADRYAVAFLVLTVALSAAAWLLSGDPLRALAVLVVATPCPLILAVPVAIISGMSRIARIGVLIKGGGVLEALARVQTAILDKTGTLTHGQAIVTRIIAAPGYSEDEILRLAASLDQASNHVMATALIDAAAARDLPLSLPHDTRETPGEGIEGRIDGMSLVVGGRAFVAARTAPAQGMAADATPGATTVSLGIDGSLAGIIVLHDHLRTDATTVLAELRQAGVRRIVLASGDRHDIVEAVGTRLGLDRIAGQLTPEGKVAIIREEASGGTVMMVGDGVNDAPALAAADVGVAMGARGTAASSEAAGVVLLVDELAPLARAIIIARRTRAIALQSVVVGLGLSLAAMLFAAFGYLPPVQGALLQELIDVAVILNALRALR